MTLNLFKREILYIQSVVPENLIHVWKYTQLDIANVSQGQPVIIIAHGLSGNKLMGLHDYAKAFCYSGFACVVFDYRRWGASGGEPRHCIHISEQLDDYRSVIKWVRQQSEFDHQKIILWGTGLSGGHILTLAAEKHLNIAAAIGQGSYVGMSKKGWTWSTFILVFYGLLDLFKQALSLRPLYLPVSAPPGRVGFLTEPGSVEGTWSLVAEKSDWPNEVSASSAFEISMYNPAALAKKIKSPLLLIAPEHDLFHDLSQTASVIGNVRDGELAVLDGGHFDLYPGQKNFEITVKFQLDFLKKILSESQKN